jgi:oxygen-independent coproporphyrinogen-3 oxidase
VRTPDRYVDLVSRAEPTAAAGETLDGPTRAFERLELMLRMRDGVPLDALDGDDLPGLVRRHGDRWVLTVRGRLMANEISTRLRVPDPGDAR